MRFLSKLLFLVNLLLPLMALASEPLIIARRGGMEDAPENTLLSIEKAVDSGADAVWLTLQLTKDNEIVLYRPADLKTLTNLQGPVSAYTAAELHRADAGYWYGKPAYPWRGKNLSIPTLAEVLQRWPNTFFFLDIKSLNVPPQLISVLLEDILETNHSVDRVRVYATDERYLAALPDTIDRFESGNATQTVLSDVITNHRCDIPSSAIEKWYDLKYPQSSLNGSQQTQINEAIRCFKNNRLAKIILPGDNDKALYQTAQTLHADGVLVESPGLFSKKS
ncbi:glycerophosphodiester phosphodiesterase family protein [Pseudescherichia sp.]|uniref:glycerophosphodiester phosphodiesterase family protein n=1 Tax=Pseudescherichia sp. TaxID=2055881 RepID=UPI00289BF8C4|nr:glycerophosphodiester phosphodiesterase family protein [Pseudescherichia sp.]